MDIRAELQNDIGRASKTIARALFQSQGNPTHLAIDEEDFIAIMQATLTSIVKIDRNQQGERRCP